MAKYEEFNAGSIQVGERDQTLGAPFDIGAIFKVAPTLTPAAVAAATAVEQTFNVPGLKVGDIVIVNPPADTKGVTKGLARVSAADTLALWFTNPTAAALTPDPGVYEVVVIRPAL